MTRQSWIVFGVGAALVLIGVIVGFGFPVHLGSSSGLSCGSPWSGTDMWAHPASIQKQCSDARQTPGIIAAVVAGLGVLIAGASFLLPRRVTSPSNS